MLDFLRRLAPPDLQAASPARAVQAPRFAAPVTPGIVALEAAADRGQQTGPATVAAEPGLSPLASSSPMPASRASLPIAAEAPPDPVRLAAAGTMSQHVGAPAQTQADHAAGRAGARAERRTEAERDGAAHIVDRHVLPAQRLRAPDPAVAIAPAATHRPGRGDAPPAATLNRGQPGAFARTELAATENLLPRRGALAPAPVIHVHIDRIDVRAPAAPSRPAGPARPRAPAPSVSLSDYLRAGSGSRKGGAS